MRDSNRHLKKYKTPDAKFGWWEKPLFHTTMTEDEYTKQMGNWFGKKPLFTNLTPVYGWTHIGKFYSQCVKFILSRCKVSPKRKHRFIEEEDNFRCYYCNETILKDVDICRSRSAFLAALKQKIVRYDRLMVVVGG